MSWQFWSPHLDDVVLSCGRAVGALTGSGDTVTVETVFAGLPRRGLATVYDRGCGFRTSRQAVLVRRGEDAEAMSLLGCTCRHHDLLDVQYRVGPVEDLAGFLAERIDMDDRVVGPLGLRHPDHVAVSDALLDVDLSHLWLYAEAPYWTREPTDVADRLADLRARGWTFERHVMPDGGVDLKRQAVACYRSQTHVYGGLGDPHSCLVRGIYWKATRT